MIKVVALMGKAGAGKDYILHQFPYHKIVSYTTRPKRENEIEGKDYFFISEKEMNDKIILGQMFEVTYFNNWIYGTSVESYSSEQLNIGVFNPEGVGSLKREEELKVMPIMIEASPKTRLLRQLNREENPNVDEIIRRYNADEKDFKKIYFKYFSADNEVDATPFVTDLINKFDSLIF